jgi:hypothetical protein
MTKSLPFTKAAIKRAIAAAQEQGAALVEMLPDGTIRVKLRQEYEVAAERPPSQTDDEDPWGHPEA